MQLTSRSSGRRIPLRILVPLMAVVLASEVVVRVIDPALPVPIDHSTRDYVAKIDQMDAVGAAGGVDVVFAGTSQVMFSVEPAALADAGVEWTSYNAAVPGASPAMNAHWILEEVVPRLRPSTVVYGIGPVDLHRTAATEMLEARYFGSRAVRPGLLADLERWAADGSALVRHRESLRQPDAVLSAVSDRARGVETPSAVEAVAAFRGLDADGHASQFASFSFTSERFPIKPADLADFEVDADVVAAVEQLVLDLRAIDVDVVLLAMPIANEMSEWLPDGESDVARAMAALRGVAARTNAPLLDLATGMTSRFWFADPMHVNDVGASVFNAALAAVFAGNEQRPADIAARWSGQPLVTAEIRRSERVVRAAQALYPTLDLAEVAAASDDARDAAPPTAGPGALPDEPVDLPVSPVVPVPTTIPDAPGGPTVPPVPPVPPVPIPTPTLPTPPTVRIPG